MFAFVEFVSICVGESDGSLDDVNVDVIVDWEFRDMFLFSGELLLSGVFGILYCFFIDAVVMECVGISFDGIRILERVGYR